LPAGATLIIANIVPDRNRAAVGVVADRLDTRNRAQPEKRQHRVPVIGRPVGETNRQRPGFMPGLVAAAPQRRRRAAEQVEEGFVETADAVEARGQRDLGHRQRRLMNQLLGQQHPPRLCHRDRRGPDMPVKQPPQLPGADAKPVGETLDIGLIETAGFDQRQCARYRVGGAAPEREIGRGFRPAAQARAKARLLGRRRGRIE
jgi:hypothetical protein